MAGLTDVMRDTAKRFNITQAEARKLIEFVCTNIGDRLANGETVSIRNFGVFKVKDIGARTIKNPQTKEQTELPPSIRLCFSATKHLKDRIKVGKGLITEEEAGLSKEADDEEAAE